MMSMLFLLICSFAFDKNLTSARANRFVSSFKMAHLGLLLCCVLLAFFAETTVSEKIVYSDPSGTYACSIYLDNLDAPYIFSIDYKVLNTIPAILSTRNADVSTRLMKTNGALGDVEVTKLVPIDSSTFRLKGVFVPPGTRMELQFADWLMGEARQPHSWIVSEISAEGMENLRIVDQKRSADPNNMLIPLGDVPFQQQEPSETDAPAYQEPYTATAPNDLSYYLPKHPEQPSGVGLATAYGKNGLDFPSAAAIMDIIMVPFAQFRFRLFDIGGRHLHLNICTHTIYTQTNIHINTLMLLP